MVRAEKEGATIGPTFGSLEEGNETSVILVGKRTRGISDSARESICHSGYDGPGPSADVSSEA